MCLDDCGLFIRWSLLLGFAELLDETHGTALEAALEATACAGVDDLIGKVKYYECMSVVSLRYALQRTRKSKEISKDQR